MPIDFNLLRSPSHAVAQGLNTGAFLNQTKEQALLKQKAAEANAQMQSDLASILSKGSPTATDYAALTVKYPQFNEQFKQAWEMLNEEQKTSRVSQASGVYAALEAGELDMAQDLLEEQALAAENSGNQSSAKAARTLAEIVKINPDTAKTSIALRLSSMMGPDKFTETFTKLEQERREKALDPAKLSKAQADARKAATEADFTKAGVVMDLQKKGWDIYKIQEDAAVAKENSRIAALNAQLKREQNEMKRDEMRLKLDELKRKRDEAVQDRTAEVQTAWTGIDNSLSTIDRLLKNPELDNVVGALEGGKFYPSVMVGILNPFASGEKRADALADIETVQGQQFLDNLMAAKQRGATFGSLTEPEGEKLEGYIRTLKTKQSEQQFRDNLREIQRLLLKSRTQLANKYGVPESIPDTPGADPSPDEIDQLLQQYGG